MVDRDGRIYDGDQLLYVIAMDYRRRGRADGGVVGTLMTQSRLRAGARRARASRSRAPRSATATCSRMLRAKGWLLGGENSGHMHLPRQAHHRRRDRRRAAVLRALIEQRTTLAEATAGVDDVSAAADQRAGADAAATGRRATRCSAARARGRRCAGRRGPRAAAAVGHRAGAARDGRGARGGAGRPHAQALAEAIAAAAA